MINKIDLAVDMIFLDINKGTSISQLLVDYIDPLSKMPLTEEEKEIVKDKIFKKNVYENALTSAEVEDPALIKDPEGHEEWYDEWKRLNPIGYYWDTLKEFLGDDYQQRYPDQPKKAGTIVRSIDNSSDKILELMESSQRLNFQTKGLVVGYVQSGKTANFTAVIAKAVDAGYRLIIVLTGIHDNLRSQTQQRLDRELTGEPDSSNLSHVRIPDFEHHKWVRMTNDHRDFDQMNLSKLDVLANYRTPLLSVMKKNCKVMRRFIEWIEQAPDDIRANIPILLIDDEADLASIDTKYDVDENPSETNKLIRYILNKFPRHAYIGYTATPFANVLIDLRKKHVQLGRDLYPRNFLVSLPKPENYLGAADIFGSDQSDRYIREISSEEAAKFYTKSRNAGSIPEKTTPCLEKAILGFYLSCAARYERGDSKKPMTMLVHTTHRQASHGKMKSVVEEFCNSIKSNWGNQYEKQELRREFINIWQNDFVNTTKELYPDRVCNFEEIEPHLNEILEKTYIFELNSAADDELDYVKHPEIKVIAIGGNKLSRGLTLEGLVTSFYLRNSNQYDTLLQMGRWFGYREGYEDLTRIYTSKELALKFEDLALVEEELRNEIYRYEEEGLTPTDVAVRIRSHRTMKVTARNKMGRGGIIQGSYSGRLVQTIWFLLDKPDVLQKNLDAGEKFITSHNGWTQAANTGSYLIKNIPCQDVLNFLNSYTFAKKDDVGGPALDSISMIEYIKRLYPNGELLQWNVAVVGKKRTDNNKDSTVKWGGLCIAPETRSRLAGTQYKVGVISSPTEIALDNPEKTAFDSRPINQNPLLLLYRISKDSKPVTVGKLVPLFEGLSTKIDVLGLVIEFPESRVEPFDYVGQNIKSG